MKSIHDLKKELRDLRLVPDSDRDIIKLLNQMAVIEYRSDLEDAEKHAEEALSLAQTLGLESEIAESHHTRGIVYWAHGDYSEALESHQSSLEIWEKLDSKRNISRAYNNMGNVYIDRGHYDEAFNYYLKALSIKKEIGDRKGIASSHLNIGNLHKEQKRLAEAMEDYNRAMSIYSDLGDSLGISSCCNNIGMIHTQMGNLVLALEQHEKALKLRGETGNVRGVGNSYGSIGKVYEKQENYEKALDYYLKALSQKEKLLERRGIAASCINAGAMYIKLGQFESADELIMKGLNLSREIGSKDLEAAGLGYLSDLFEDRGDFQKALSFSRDFLEKREELFSTQSRERIASLQVRFDTEKRQKEAEICQLRNVELQEEIVERRKVEAELKEHRDHLEEIVQERTAELSILNQGLEAEISERIEAEKALIEARNSLSESYEQLEKSFKATVFTISKIIEMRDPYAIGHQLQTAELARAISREMDLSEEKIQSVYLSSIVHDIGKIRIPQEFLSRSGKLSEIELNVIRAYPRTGYDILKTIDFPWPIADIVLQHHEFLDGSGYPQSLKGDEISLEARIVCVADAVEAMSSLRPYRRALSVEEVLEELAANRNTLFDGRVVDVCTELIRSDRFRIQDNFAVITRDTR
ncbi:MAG: tetratricopeptide repeat protein [Candidatus Sabulitectum sp.]|nr:tetratricopeptide repeat protein [Candidatus Sabulitectum sp.]